MEKENARKQTLEQLHERRKQVVRLHRKDIKIMQIVSMTGLSYPAVRATIDRYEEGGWSAVRPTARGRARGDGRCLSEAQEDTIRRIIIDKRQEQLKMAVFLWSRAAVGQRIRIDRAKPRSDPFVGRARSGALSASLQISFLDLGRKHEFWEVESRNLRHTIAPSANVTQTWWFLHPDHRISASRIAQLGETEVPNVAGQR